MIRVGNTAAPAALACTLGLTLVSAARAETTIDAAEFKAPITLDGQVADGTTGGDHGVSEKYILRTR